MGISPFLPFTLTVKVLRTSLAEEYSDSKVIQKFPWGKFKTIC